LLKVDRSLAIEFAKMIQSGVLSAAGLLAEHREVDGRCAVCGSVGTGRVTWPCTTYSLATAAEKLGPLVQRGR